MALCQQCGTEAAAPVLFCAACGANVTAPDVKAPDPAVVARLACAGDAPPDWRRRFALLEQAGGVKLPHISALPLGARTQLVFNAWGFLFGPFYYLAQGMWKKALTLSLAVAALLLVLQPIMAAAGISGATVGTVSAPLVLATFAMRANIDYYKKKVLSDDSWW